MKNKILSLFSSNVKIKVQGKNINNFIKRLIKNNINIIRVIPISYKEVGLIIDYKYLEEILKYKTIYDIKIERYYGKLNILRLIKKNIFIISFLILGIIVIYVLSNIIFKVEVIHSNSKLIKSLTEELEEYGIKKYAFVKSHNEIEKIENEIIDNNKDKIEWLEIIREGTKYIVRVEERILNNKVDNNKRYDIVASKNAVIKRITAESGMKVKEIDTYVKKGDVVISSDIVLPNNEIRSITSKGNVIGEVWYNVSINYPYHYYEVKYTGKKRKVLVFNLINKRIPFFNFHEYKTFDKDIKYIFNNNLNIVNLCMEYQYETNIIDKKYNYEEAKEVASEKVKDKLKEKYPGIIDIPKVIIIGETDSMNYISLNLFVATLEDITEYREVIEETQE